MNDDWDDWDDWGDDGQDDFDDDFDEALEHLEAQIERENKQMGVTPSEFLDELNDALECEFSPSLITGEVASFKVNQGKWVFFDLKDETASVGCFMPLWDLHVPLEDGMKVTVKGVPKVTNWGKFSVTVKNVQPVGEGSLKKAYEKLKRKLAGEGLFDSTKKRKIPEDLTRLGVISSTGAAGYADFIKIVNARWGGMKISVAHTQVQGLDAAEQIMRALSYFNERGEVQMIAILRGGGSADDLACFNDEALVRAVAASKIPVICGIGHEIDESLCDLACDVRASTPSNAAEMLTPDKRAVKARVRAEVGKTALVVRNAVESEKMALNENLVVLKRRISEVLRQLEAGVQERMTGAKREILTNFERISSDLKQKQKILEAVNPDRVLKQGYAIVGGEIDIGNVVKITTFEREIEAKINKIKERK